MSDRIGLYRSRNGTYMSDRGGDYFETADSTENKGRIGGVDRLSSFALAQELSRVPCFERQTRNDLTRPA
jgi:hypothetical protein